MQIIERFVCEVVSSHPNSEKQLKIWKVKEHPDKDLIGDKVYCGLPQARNYPIGMQYVTEIKIP